MGYSRGAVSSMPPASGVMPRHFAALDLGTNNCRLMIAKRTPGGVQIMDRQNRMVCLGEGLIETGTLSIRAMDRALRTLEAYAARLEGLHALQVRAVATEACRRAMNRDSFLSRVREETGLSLEVISPREEVELAVEGCRNLLHRNPLGSQRAIVFDIGGGSTEVAWLRLNPATCEQQVVSLVSLPFGVVTLAEHFGQRMGNAQAGQLVPPYEEMVQLVLQPLLAFEGVHQIKREMQRGSVQMLGTSGTVTTLASMAQNLERYSRYAVDGYMLNAQDAHEAVSLVRQSALAGQSAPTGLSPDRQQYMLPGCAIFEAIHRVWPAEQVIVADRGLRDGMVARMAFQAANAHDVPNGGGRHGATRNGQSNYRGHAASSSFMGRA